MVREGNPQDVDAVHTLIRLYAEKDQTTDILTTEPAFHA